MGKIPCLYKANLTCHLHNRIYIYYTGNGDEKYKISEIFEFMLKHIDFDEILTFSQCFTCNKIATVGT